MEIIKIDNCVGFIKNFLGFKAVFIGFLMMSNWLFFYLINDTFFSNFYDNNSVNREVQ